MLNTINENKRKLKSNNANMLKANEIMVGSHNDYSVRKLFTGFAIAASTAWKLTVTSAIRRAMAPAIASISQLRLTLYAKPCDQALKVNQERGEATIKEIVTNLKKSFEKSLTIPDIEAPKTFRIPISLVLCKML